MNSLHWVAGSLLALIWLSRVIGNAAEESAGSVEFHQRMLTAMKNVNVPLEFQFGTNSSRTSSTTHNGFMKTVTLDAIRL